MDTKAYNDYKEVCIKIIEKNDEVAALFRKIEAMPESKQLKKLQGEHAELLKQKYHHLSTMDMYIFRENFKNETKE